MSSSPGRDDREVRRSWLGLGKREGAGQSNIETHHIRVSRQKVSRYQNARWSEVHATTVSEGRQINTTLQKKTHFFRETDYPHEPILYKSDSPT